VNMLERFDPPRPERKNPLLNFPVWLICSSLAFMPIWISFLAWGTYRVISDAISPFLAPLAALLRSAL
jgi:hypothetical protein